MKRMPMLAACLALGSLSLAWAQSPPASQPARTDPNAMLQGLLAPGKLELRPLDPLPERSRMDAASQRAVAPGATPQPLRAEGTMLSWRQGRLRKTADNQQEFVFEADGESMQDPPMIVLPNLKLMQMENMLKQGVGELRFSISGMVTEYNGRNYILIEGVRAVGNPQTPVTPAAR